MNYGKTAYLKVLDLEKELNHTEGDYINYNSYLEISKPNIYQTLTKQTSVPISLPEISVESEKTICFQIKATLNTSFSGTVQCELTVDDCVIHEDSKVLQTGENDFVLFKTFTPITTKNIKTTLVFFTEDENFSATLSKLSIIVLGARGDSVTAEIEMRATLLSDKTLISYIDSEKLYYTMQSLEATSLKASDFTYLLPAKSHCFCLESFDNKEETSTNINLYRVEPSGNLYASKPFQDTTETLIDTNVEIVHACISPTITENSNVIVYIKNGSCYYRTRTGSTITNAKKLSLPSGVYNDIRVVSNVDSDYVYVIASHENGSNYILRSIIEVSTGNLIECINLKYNISVTKYIDLSIVTRNSVETLSLDMKPILKAFYDYDKIFKRLGTENLNLSYSLSPTKYTVDFDGIYGVRLDKSIMTAGAWESYTDDAEGLEGSYMDFDNNVFVDNGWKERWPFNKIKPCLLKDGEVVGYLNPDNYDQFEDGTTASTNNRLKGDVMIEIPKIYYKLTSDENYITVQISRKARAGFTDRAFWHNGKNNSKIYVGAYLSGDTYMSTRGFFSTSGSTLNDLYSVSYEKHYKYKVKYSADNYEFFPFSVVTMLQCLYLIMFKNTNSQASLGYGWNTAKKKYKTGQLNTKGMYYGTKGGGSGIKIFGIEDLYGVKMTVVTGFYVDTDGNPRFIDVYDTNSSYDPAYVDSYITTSKQITLSPTYSYNLLDITGENEVGFVNYSSDSDRTKGFTDYSYPRRDTTSLIYGLTRFDEDYGIFNSEAVKSTSADTRRNIRLVYYPDNN